MIIPSQSNELPEWSKASPVKKEEDSNDFSTDFGHPDAPKKMPLRMVSDQDVELNAMQMFDVVHGKGVIGIIDRRAGGRRQVKEDTEIKKNDIVSLLRKKMEPKTESNAQKEQIPVGNFVLMVKNKVIGSGSLEDISEVILTLIAEDGSLTDDDFVLFQRVGLDTVVEAVNQKY